MGPTKYSFVTTDVTNVVLPYHWMFNQARYHIRIQYTLVQTLDVRLLICSMLLMFLEYTTSGCLSSLSGHLISEIIRTEKNGEPL
jgi:hypothetical protein